MATMKAKYLGQLRVECEHVASGTKMMTLRSIIVVKGKLFHPPICVLLL